MSSKERNKAMSELLYDCDVCVEQIIWLAGQGLYQSSAFIDFVDMQQDDLPKLLGIELDDGCEMDAETVVGELVDLYKNGFLVQLSTPVPHRFSENGGYSTGGTRRVEWYYTENFDGIEEIAVKFAEEVVEMERKRQGK